jgi:hypothetical protein
MSDQENDDEVPDLIEDEQVNYYQDYVYTYEDEFMNELLLSLRRRGISNIYSNLATSVFSMVGDIYPFNLYDDVLERVMHESLETHNELNRTDDFVEFTTIQYSSFDNKDKYDSSCSVCLVEFELDSEIGITNCDHVFHKECITEWSRYKKDCPVCREDLKNKIEKKD